MPLKIAATKNMPREQWLQLRKQGIGGSDAGAVCGVNPYRSAFNVYHDKISEELSEAADNERMRQGRDLEDYCARRFSEATGLKVCRTNYLYRHETYDFMIADLDRVIVGENAGLECKTASAWSADKWKRVDTVPETYLLQCQHYMAVMGYDSMYLACVVLGADFTYFRIDRNEELIANLIKVEQDFWENYVLKKVIPDPDGSKAYDDMLSEYFPARKNSSIPLVGFDEALDRRKELGQLISKMETEKKQIDQRLKLYLSENEVAESSKYRVTWKLSEATGTRRFTVKEAA